MNGSPYNSSLPPDDRPVMLVSTRSWAGQTWTIIKFMFRHTRKPHHMQKVETDAIIGLFCKTCKHGVGVPK